MRQATSVWVIRFETGVRNSWAISAEKSDKRRNDDSSRSSMPLKAITSANFGRCVALGKALAETSSADKPRAVAVTRRSGASPRWAANRANKAAMIAAKKMSIHRRLRTCSRKRR
jgi:hypothetical protein